MWTFAIAVGATFSLFASIHWQASRTPISVAFSFADAAFSAAPEIEGRLGGPLTVSDIAAIKRISRAEIERAFAGLPIRVTDGPGFWRIRVIPTVITQSFNRRMRINAAGASYGFGPLGGGGFVNFNTLARNAARYAPPGASRRQIVEGIARGIGRSAVHELAHMMVAGIPIDSRADVNAYEYNSADRASQYYGELRWTSAWPVIQRKIGR